ncbi:Nucleotidylyl transferase [Annulohypoxylon nitens]|nr:Nucleotidylyl transferase [Annulohypoxylon nitens]KAI1444444.1 Nucleotidylyl transferase [Annulohypoxylon stygium]
MTNDVAGPVPLAASAMTLENYAFPAHRLLRQQTDPERIPLVLVACGSFSPITYLHLRMFEMANDYARINTQYEVVGGYLSPVSDAYKKAGLAESRHRVRMCELAAEETSSWLMVDPWEALQPDYMPTAKVLDHFEYEINQAGRGVLAADGETRRPVKIMLLAGADLIGTMSTPGVWAEKDLDHILGNYGAMIVERDGTDMDEALANLKQWEDNIHVIAQMIQNNVSSTKIRLFLRRDMSVQYLIPASVIQYIDQNRLYTDDGEGKSKEKEKQRATV